jgi:hypothetical protein
MLNGYGVQYDTACNILDNQKVVRIKSHKLKASGQNTQPAKTPV